MSSDSRDTQTKTFKMDSPPDDFEPNPKVTSSRVQHILFVVAGLLGCAALAFMISTLILWVQHSQLDTMDPEYILAASKVFERMNLDADPCEDFYEYVCGNYRDTNLFNADDLESLAIATSHIHGDSIIPRLLNKIVNTKEKSCDSELKVVQFYHSCMNEFVDLNLSNSEHVRINLTKYSDEDTAKSVVEFFRDMFTFDLRFSDGFVDKLLVQWPAFSNFHSLFFQVLADMLHVTAGHSIWIAPIDFSVIPSFFPVFQKADGNFTLSERGLDYVLNLLFEASEFDNAKRQQLSDNVRKSVFGLLKLYAAINDTSEEHEFESSSNGTDYEKWINFFSEFKGLLPVWASDKSLKITLSLSDASYFELLNNTDILNVPKNFMELQIISTLHFLLWETNNTYVDLSSSDETVVSKATDPLARELQCLDKTSKYFYINGVLTNAYMKYYMGEDSFYTFDRLVQKEREMLLEFLDKVQFVDTRNSLKDYIRKIEVRPALDQLECQYSDNLLEGSDLTSDTEASFADKLLSLNKFYREIHAKTGEARLISWHFTFNAMYNSVNQQVLFLTFFIDSIYTSKNPVPLNYGGIGSIIGHEFSHSMGPGVFSESFINNDKYTWDRKTNDSYHSFVECLVALYDRENISGSISLDDNYSDIMGLKVAYNAMKTKEDMNRIREELKKSPILSQFTPEKLFFISWGQTWCKAYLNQQKSMVIESSQEHAPSWARVNLVASMFPQFAEEFKCQKEDFMASAHHCKIWP